MSAMLSLNEVVSAVCADRTSGSTELAQRLLARIAQGGFSADELEEARRKVLAAHPDMAVLRRLFSVLERTPFEGVPTAAGEFLSSLRAAPERIARHLAEALPSGARLMLYSRSGTVERCVLAAHRWGKVGSVVLSEARPDLEGKALAEDLAAHGIPTTLTVDCALGCFVDGVDVVLVGADAVTPEYIVNKVGTLQLALLANYAGKRILCLASVLKFVESLAVKKSASPPWRKLPEGVKPDVPLFERVPLALLSAVVCERGFVGDVEIKRILE